MQKDSHSLGKALECFLASGKSYMPNLLSHVLTSIWLKMKIQIEYTKLAIQ